MKIYQIGSLLGRAMKHYSMAIRNLRFAMDTISGFANGSDVAELSLQVDLLVDTSNGCLIKSAATSLDGATDCA